MTKEEPLTFLQLGISSVTKRWCICLGPNFSEPVTLNWIKVVEYDVRTCTSALTSHRQFLRNVLKSQSACSSRCDVSGQIWEVVVANMQIMYTILTRRQRSFTLELCRQQDGFYHLMYTFMDFFFLWLHIQIKFVWIFLTRDNTNILLHSILQLLTLYFTSSKVLAHSSFWHIFTFIVLFTRALLWARVNKLKKLLKLFRSFLLLKSADVSLLPPAAYCFICF